MNQKTALDILKLGDSVYLTGAAGSGKTYLLNKFIEHLKKEKISFVATASTGIAATHLRGMTIHSWSGIGVENKLSHGYWAKLKRNDQLRERIAKTRVLIIDEISMLHNYQLDMVDEICRYFLKNSKPFGGIQVVMCGDFFQLPPVSKDNNNPSISVMQSAVWGKMPLKVCYLDKIYRQKEGKLNDILNRIRDRKIDDGLFDFLDSLIGKKNDFLVGPTKLYTHNADVDTINTREIRKLMELPKFFYMRQKGDEKLVAMLRGNSKIGEKLILKKRAVVMFIKNNPGQGYANGTVGQVIDFEKESGWPVVKISSGQKIIASPEKWSIDDERGKAIASIEQVPLKLAWAITVHKSQGMTLDAVEMDLGKCFAYGMGYVALSRAKSFEGMRLLGLNYKALEVDPMIHEADKLLKKWSMLVEKEFLKNHPPTIRERLKRKFQK